MNNNIKSHIIGLGHHVPNRIINNDYFTQFMDTSDDWIKERTGIRERRWAKKNEGPSDIAIPAVEMALDNAHLTTNDIDFIIFSTSTPDYYIPGSGCLIQDKMNFKTIGALDIRCQCSGFIYALSIADQYIKSGTYSNILVITSEVQSTAMDLSNEGRDTAIIFADGAAAAVLSASNNDRGILSTHLHTEGRHVKKLWVEAPSSKTQPRLSDTILQDRKHFLHMDGKEVFKHAVNRFPEVIIEGLKHNNLSSDDIDLLIPHQASGLAVKAYSKFGGFDESKVVNIINTTGNCVAASIPLALALAYEQKLFNRGDLLYFVGTGAGLSVASTLLRY